MTEIEEEIRDAITRAVWAGFDTPAEVRDMVDEMLEDEILVNDIPEPDCDVGQLEAFIASEFQRKRAAEASWPAETDCDRLDRLFDRLNREGICALANAGYTMSESPNIDRFGSD